ncbi:MAG TPA: TonB-dependent receptor [Puia sp.]|uniref:TonB-dependent receptor n=1 Tax=Puia sp. TaxID=2045100 RepID=UPI002CD44AAA|nr:TonB-dependent receptor [Puia sp.]HVU94709.1 TonB-dependent receptor [Puia sp.]
MVSRLCYSLLLILGTLHPGAQPPPVSIEGRITGNGHPLAGATIGVGTRSTLSDSNGFYRLRLDTPVKGTLRVSHVGYQDGLRKVILAAGEKSVVDFDLAPSQAMLNEIVVTGVSRATLVRENPVAIVAVSSRKIDGAIESNVIDALVKNVPGLNSVKTGPNISKPFIRGLGYNRVLTLYDGVRQEGQQWGDEHGIEVDAYNIDKAEVIKGPASLQFGSDAVAGVVSLFPWLPREKDGRLHGRLLGEYQSNNGLIGNALRLGFNDGRWRWAASGSYRLAKNYTNAVDGRVYNTGFREANVSISTGYASAKGTTTLNATAYNNLQGIPDGSRDSLTRRFTRQVAEGDADDIKNRPIVSGHDLNSYVLSPLHQHIQHYRLYTNSHYRLGNGELDATAGFQQNIRREYDHPTEPGQAGLFVRLNTVNYGVRYTYPVAEGLDVTAGVNGMIQNNKSRQATDFPIPDYRLLDAGSFVYGKWKQRQLTFSGGLRFDTRHIRSNNFYVAADPATDFSRQAHAPDTTGASLQFPALDKVFSGLSLSAGMAWQIGRCINLKANIARGYRSPNITEIASNGLDPGAHIVYLGNRNFGPEFSLEEDLGVDGEFRQWSFSVSVFNNHIGHYIYLSQQVDMAGRPRVDAQGNKTFQYQQAAARLYGLEAAFSFHPAGWPGVAFDNSLVLTYGVNSKEDYKGKGVQGEYLPLIPPARWTSGVVRETTIRSKLVRSVTGKAELEYDASQNRYLALYGTETPTASYALMNLSIGVTIFYTHTQSLQLQFQANNLLNTAYQSSLSRLKYFEYYSASPNGRLGIYNMGRNIGVKMIAGF